MRIGPKYKIARRLGPNLFDKTQTQKYSISEGRKKPAVRRRPKSDFGLQLLEKQRARFMYGVNERQFAKYVADAISQKGGKPETALFERLETRLDNVVYRIGLAPTRQAARQMVSHGHIRVNEAKVDIPSYNLSVGETIKIRPGSVGKGIFIGFEERLKERVMPPWLSYDLPKKEGKMLATPKYTPSELPFSVSAILEFYRR